MCNQCEKPKFNITTPIYYPSGNMHIGHTYTTVAAVFMNWVEYGFDWAGFDPMADGSGVPNYIGYELTPVEMKKDLPDYVVPAGVSALSLAGAGALAFGGVKILKKKKQDV